MKPYESTTVDTCAHLAKLVHTIFSDPKEKVSVVIRTNKMAMGTISDAR